MPNPKKRQPIPIDCPVKPCPIKVNPKDRDAQQELQHHLWMYHNIDVVVSHEMARNVVEYRYAGKEVNHA